MLKNIRLTFFLLLSTQVVFSQVSGYLGKRFIVGYSTYFMIGLKGPGANSATARNLFSTTINNTHCLNFDYTIKQRKNICVTLQYFKTGIAYSNGKAGFLASESYNGEYCYPDRVAYRGKFAVPAQLSSFNFGLGYKMFKKGCVAPVGGYQKLEALVLFEKVVYDNKNFAMADPDNFYNPDIPIAKYGLGEYSYRNLVLSYTIGKQRVFFDRISIDYGLRLAIAPSGVGAIVFDDFFYDASSIEAVYKRESRKRVFGHQLINFHLGIGFLAF